MRCQPKYKCDVSEPECQQSRGKCSRSLTGLNGFDSRPCGVPMSLETKVWSAVGFKSKAHSHVTVIHLKHTHTHRHTRTQVKVIPRYPMSHASWWKLDTSVTCYRYSKGYTEGPVYYVQCSSAIITRALQRTPSLWSSVVRWASERTRWKLCTCTLLNVLI